jgi:dynein light chain 1
MSKGTTIKDALKLWEEKTGQKADEAETVKLLCLIPFIQKMDNSLGALSKCKHLGLSTNQIDKISNLQGLSNLTVLSLARNSIKKIENLEPVSDTLKELWLSYNLLERINGVECCKKLEVLYVAQNKIKGWEGFDKLKDLPSLKELVAIGNPLEEKLTIDKTWRDEMAKRFLNLKKLDGKPIIRDDEVNEDGKEEGA